MSFHAVVVFGPEHDFLFKSASTYCVTMIFVSLLLRWLSRESQEVSVVAAEATLLTMIASGPHCALLPLWAPPAVDGVAVALELALGAAVGLELLLELRL